MRFDTNFAGRIIQVTEALSYADAVSNQVLALDSLFSSMGLRAAIYTKFHDSRLETRRKSIEDLTVHDSDILVYHFYGYAEHTLPVVRRQYCTRILLYHNITPHTFFSKSSATYDFCRIGRVQLAESISFFRYFWADSQFNLEEVVKLGAPAERCNVVPIIVSPPAESSGHIVSDSGVWLYVGRVAPNKCQVKLLNLFASIRKEQPCLARELHITGGYDESDDYYLELLNRINELGLTNVVRVHGKISDDERNIAYKKASVYVSLSEHEGFGVPLIEASLHNLPVLALGSSAIPETLGFGISVAPDMLSLRLRLLRVLTESDYRECLLAQQRINAMRFTLDAVADKVCIALREILPRRRQFQRVSVVICTYNRVAYLERALDYLSHQSSSAFEVIVVDGPSTDGTKEALAALGENLKIAHNPERNLAKSRNLGIELSDGDIVAFIDDDALPFDNWVENILVEYNRRPMTTCGIGGPAYYAGTFWFQAEDNGINRRAETKVSIPSEQIGKDGWWRYNTGTNATFSTALIRAAGGFDEQFDYYLDESEVCFRLQQQGMLVAYSERIVVRHEFAQSHNRLGNLNYNWHTICKNTAYFICAYSGLSGVELDAYIAERMATERLAPINDALASGSIDTGEHARHVESIWAGVKTGMIDAKKFPQTRHLDLPPGRFLPYPTTLELPAFSAGRRSLHVAIISKEFPPFCPGGGVGTLYYHLVSELLLMGNRVSVIVPGDRDHTFKQGNICVHFTPIAPIAVSGADPGFSRNLGWSISALTKLADVHKETPVDVVDSALWDAEALSLALLPVHKRPPIVVRLVTPYLLASQINEWTPRPETEALFASAERALLDHADAIVPISESIAASVENLYKIHRTIRWHRIPCGIAYWPFFDVNSGYGASPKLDGLSQSVLESSKIVLFVGRLERRKGFDLVLAAAEEFLTSDAAARLVVAGRDVEGWSERLSTIIPDSLRPRVHMLGEVKDVIREKLFALAYCVLFPSRYESFGLVPLEAFVHGAPVIAARSGAIPEVVEDHISGLLFASENSTALADAVKRLLLDPKLRASLSRGALRRVKELNSRQSAINSYLLYDRLLRSRRTNTFPPRLPFAK